MAHKILFRPCRAVAGCLAEEDDGQASIGVPGIAAAVPALALAMEPVDPLHGEHRPRLLKTGNEAVALGIDVGSDVVGDLAGGVAEADAPVEGGGTVQAVRPS